MLIKPLFRFLVVGLFLYLLLFKPSFAFSQSAQPKISIPKSIQAEAERRLIPLSEIQLRGSQWVACIHGDRLGESCIVLGDNVQPTSSTNKAKHGRASLDTLPRFRREYPRLVRTTDIELIKDYMSQHPNDPFMVVVTVPSQCEPCRRLDLVLKNYHQNDQFETKKMKTFILEYFTFGEAEAAALGAGAVFPTTIVFPRVSELPKKELPRLAYGISSASELATISKRIADRFNRHPTSVARGSLNQNSLNSMLQTANFQ